MDLLSFILGRKTAGSGGGGGGSDPVLINKNISANGTYNASSDDADGFKKVVVAVPNSYSASDEGKVVSNGALVAQTAHADVTPTTSDQTIDTTLNNSLKVIGDADLVAGNIKKDVEIFGVTGSYEGSGGISPDLIASDMNNQTPYDITLTVTSITRSYAFDHLSIEKIYAPNLASIVGTHVFSYCQKLGSIIFPELLTIAGQCFAYAGGTSMSGTNCILVFPKLTTLGTGTSSTAASVFDRGRFLAVDFGEDLDELSNSAFYHNSGEQIVGTLILRKKDGVVSAYNVYAITGVRDVYVPNDLISTYEAASNWSTRVTGGYITFHQIEGSQYETHYADGTVIPTT
jgi:hypothetical protein